MCEERKNKFISCLEKEYNKKFQDVKELDYPNYKTMSINDTDIMIGCLLPAQKEKIGGGAL